MDLLDWCEELESLWLLCLCNVTHSCYDEVFRGVTVQEQTFSDCQIGTQILLVQTVWAFTELIDHVYCRLLLSGLSFFSSRNPLKFTMEEVTNVQLFPETDEPVNILNIKRGIVSALMVPFMEDKHYSHMVSVTTQGLKEKATK